MPKDLIALARAVYQAYQDKDLQAMQTLAAADLKFTSPLDNHIDRATYFDRCWPNSKNIRNFQFIYLVADGDRVFVTYEGLSSDGHRFRNTEILTFRQSQLVEAEVYFGWSLPHPAPDGGFVASESV